MTVYVDALVPTPVTLRWPYASSCHLMADPCMRAGVDREVDLVDFAFKLGLATHWLQWGGGGEVPHFDLTPGMRGKALRRGAVEIDRETFLALLTAWRRKK